MKEKDDNQYLGNTSNVKKKYHEQLYANKLGNPEEMDAFLEKHKLPKLEQEEIENLNRSVTREEISRHQKPPKTQKSRARWLPWGILSNV